MVGDSEDVMRRGDGKVTWKEEKGDELTKRNSQ